MSKEKETKKGKESDPEQKHLSKKKEVEEQLLQIYSDKDGEMPDLTKLDRNKGSWFTRFLVRSTILLIVLGGIAWGGFLLWKPYQIRTSDTLAIGIEGPSEVTAGEEVRYVVNYENIAAVPLAFLEIKVNFPNTFTVNDTRPEATHDNIWTVGSLTPGSDGTIEILGTFSSPIPSSEKVQAFFTYKPANFNSDFQDIANKSVEVTGSILEMGMTGPGKALPGDEVQYVIEVKNNGQRAAKNLLVRSSLPESLTVSSVNPESVAEDIAEWKIDSLEPDEVASITITGVFTSDAAGTLKLASEVGFLNNDNYLLHQALAEQATDILGGDLTFHLIVNGSNEDQALDLDDNLRLSISYSNNGKETIENVAFKLLMNSEEGSLPINWDEAALSEAKQDGNTLVWDKDIIENLGSLQPNDTGIIDVTLPVLEKIDPEIGDKFTLQLNASLDKVGSVESYREIETSPVAIQINSDAAFRAFSVYHDEEGNELGSGPLPPKVGETTTYRIFWNVQNSMHDLKDIAVSTNLPPDVAWGGASDVEIGTIVYNETTRLITWTVDSMPDEIVEVEAQFDVVITPEEEDVGAFFKLTNPTSFQATDAVTGSNLHASADILDSEIPLDSLAKGKGIVVEE